MGLMKELNALNDIYQNQMYESKKADKDYDGDGKIESGTDEYMGSRDKAIKKAMAGKGMKKEETEEIEEKAGLYANIHAKRKRGGKMRKKGAKGAPTAENFRRAKQTVRKK